MIKLAPSLFWVFIDQLWQAKSYKGQFPKCWRIQKFIFSYNHIILAVISNDLTISCSESFAWNLWIKFEIIISGLKATHVRWPGMTRSCSSWSVRRVGLDRWTSRPCPPHKPCCPTAPPSTTNLSVWFKQSFNLYLW